LALDDGLALAHIGLGWVYYESIGDAQAAEAEFSQAIEIAPAQGDGYAAMGELRARQQQYGEAEEWYVQAVDRNPNSRWWQLARASAVRSAADLERAARLYQDVTVQFPDFGEAYFELGLTYDLLGEPDRAAGCMDEALAKMMAPIAWHYDQAGRVYAAAGEWGMSADAYARALALDTTDSTATEGLLQAEAMLAQPGVRP
jgi:tetratricopeptide (TPR) repeat protein